ncbi:MAG: tautomerase family protein [Acidimicrobiia bacterium]
MPLTQISLREGKPAEYRNALMEQTYLAMRDTIGIPEHDRFATITEHHPDNFRTSGDYLGVARSEDAVFIRITLNTGRSTDQKKALYARIAERLASDPGVRPEDIVIVLTEVTTEDWSLGNGLATYA